MKELSKRNSEIAAYIDSLGAAIPGEEQQSILLTIGGVTGVGGGWSNTSTNCGDNCGACRNESCAGKANGGNCVNYNNSCDNTLNGGTCVSTKEPMPSTNLSVVTPCR